MLLEFTTLLLLRFPNHPASEAALQQICPRHSTATTRISDEKSFVSWGPLLVLGGGLLRNWCFRTLGRFFTFDLAILKEHRLVTSGPYAYVRHPSYTGGIMMCIGIIIQLYGSQSYLSGCGILTSSYWPFRVCAFLPGFLAFITATGMVYRCKTEDQMLLSKFGIKWDDYRKAVPHSLVPGII